MQAAKAGEPAREDRLVTKGIPALCNQEAWLPNSAPSPMITEERKAAYVGLTLLRRGGWHDACSLWADAESLPTGSGVGRLG